VISLGRMTEGEFFVVWLLMSSVVVVVVAAIGTANLHHVLDLVTVLECVGSDHGRNDGMVNGSS